MIHIFYKNELFAFWTFTKIQPTMFCLEISRSGKQFQMDSSSVGRWSKVGKGSTLNGALGVPRFKVGTSDCECMHRRRNADSLQWSAIVNVDGCGCYKTNSYSIVYQSKTDDNLGFFFAFWNWERSSVPIERNVRSWVLYRKKFWLISIKNGRGIVRGNFPSTLSFILTMPLHIGHRGFWSLLNHKTSSSIT
jgi:hypothetical protein